MDDHPTSPTDTRRPMPSDDDRRLQAMLRAGDPAAWVELHERFWPSIVATARQVTRSDEGAHDVTQEVFVTFWRQADEYDVERGSLHVWMQTLTRRRAVDWVRREQAARRRESMSPPVSVAPDDVERLALNDVLALEIDRALAQLPDQRDAVSLAYRQGLSYRQVGQRLGIPEGTAKARIRRGLQRLAAALAREGPEIDLRTAD